MEQPLSPSGDTPDQKESTASFVHAQIAIEQDRLRRAMEEHLLRRSRIPSTRVFTNNLESPKGVSHGQAATATIDTGGGAASASGRDPDLLHP